MTIADKIFTSGWDIVPEDASGQALGDAGHAWNLFAGDITILDDAWIGLGAAAGRMVFDDQATDRISLMACDVGVAIAVPEARFDVSWGGLTMALGADADASTRTDNTTKIARIGVKHYDIDEEHAGLLVGAATLTENLVWIGGGTNQMNAATEVRIYTAANTTTVIGTQRVTVDSAGNVGIGMAAPVNARVCVHTTDAENLDPLELYPDDDATPFTYYKGRSTPANITKTLVDDGDVTTSSQVVWLKVYVEDVNNNIVDGDYWIVARSLT